MWDLVRDWLLMRQAILRVTMGGCHIKVNGCVVRWAKSERCMHLYCMGDVGLVIAMRW